MLTVTVALLGVLGGCDAMQVHTSESTDSQTTDDHEVRAEAETFEKADLFFESGIISAGETFSIGLIDSQYEAPVTQITHEGMPSGHQSLSASFSPLEPTSVTVECRNRGDVLYRQDPGVSSGEDDYEIGVATIDREPDSYHYSSNGETVIVGVDYDEREMEKSGGEKSQAAVKFSSSKQSKRCTHVFFVLDGVSTTLSPSGVVFSGASEQLTLEEKKFK